MFYHFKITQIDQDTKYFLTAEIKDYNVCNVMIDGRNFFDQPVKNYLKTYDNIWRTSTGQVDDNTTERAL